MFRMLDAEFALVLYDHRRDKFIAARDPIGIRPLFYGKDENGDMLFASEAKNLVGLCKKIIPFPPGHYYDGENFVCYRDMTTVETVCEDDLETVCRKIREKLVAGIESGWIPTYRWVSCSAADWIPPWSVLWRQNF